MQLFRSVDIGKAIRDNVRKFLRNESLPGGVLRSLDNLNPGGLLVSKTWSVRCTELAKAQVRDQSQDIAPVSRRDDSAMKAKQESTIYTARPTYVGNFGALHGWWS